MPAPPPPPETPPGDDEEVLSSTRPLSAAPLLEDPTLTRCDRLLAHRWYSPRAILTVATVVLFIIIILEASAFYSKTASDLLRLGGGGSAADSSNASATPDRSSSSSSGKPTTATSSSAGADQKSTSNNNDPPPLRLETYTDKQLLSAMRALANFSALPALRDAFFNMALTHRRAFPTIPWLQVSSDALVAARGVSLPSLFGCYGKGSMAGADPGLGPMQSPQGASPQQQQRSAELTEAQHAKRYDVAFFPIGCFGDGVGHTCTSLSCKVGALLARFRPCAETSFAAVLGDNFYPHGLRSNRDRRLDHEMYWKFWRHPGMAGPETRYYATVGNHDNPKAHSQIRTDHPSWVMPAFHHVSPMITVGPTTVQLFLFDTHWGYSLNDPHMPHEAAWLDSALANSTAQWKVVGTHEPIWGFAGFEHGKGLVQHIHPVLVKHKVRLFVCAHAHSVQLHMTPGHYYQLVAAGLAENIHTIAKPRRPPGYFHMGTGGVTVLFSGDEATVVAFDREERVIFSHVIQRVWGSGASSPAVGGRHQAGSSTDGADTDPDLLANGVRPSDRMWQLVPFCESFLPFVHTDCH